MVGRMLLVLCIAVGARAEEHLTSLLLKQAADELRAAPFPSSEPQYHPGGLARVEVPSPQDLLLSRLQGELELRVEDNWLSLNDPQRWAIMQTKDPAKQILKSFEQIKNSSTILEESVNVEGLEKVLNGLNLSGEERDQWIPYWEDVRREVGKIAQLYNYFRGYIEDPETSASALQDFATSVSLASVPGRESLSALLDTFHETVCTKETARRQLFPYLALILEVTHVVNDLLPHIEGNLPKSKSKCFCYLIMDQIQDMIHPSTLYNNLKYPVSVIPYLKYFSRKLTKSAM